MASLERRTRWREVAPWLAPALLVAVALLQVGLAHSVALSPWKGGGFGMFSTTDRGSARGIRVWAVGRGGAERRLEIPNRLSHLRYRTRDLPSPGSLVRFARALAAAAPEAVEGAEALRVEVWRTDYDPDSLEPRRRTLREQRVPLP